MAWSSNESDDTVLPLDQLLKLESSWNGAAREHDVWHHDMTGWGYRLVGEYEMDEDRTLYRYELDEDRRPGLRLNASHWMNVVLSKKADANATADTVFDFKAGTRTVVLRPLPTKSKATGM